MILRSPSLREAQAWCFVLSARHAAQAVFPKAPARDGCQRPERQPQRVEQGRNNGDVSGDSQARSSRGKFKEALEQACALGSMLNEHKDENFPLTPVFFSCTLAP